MIFLSACSSSKVSVTKSSTEPSLHFLDEWVIPFNSQFQQTTIGGLSSIDYNKGKDIYYIISDDRSAINPARFYQAQIILEGNKIKNISFLSADTLRRYNGDWFPSFTQDPLQCPDPESLRYVPGQSQFIWASEGERLINHNGKYILLDPAIYIADSTGKMIDSFSLPSNFKMSTGKVGPRRNGTIESLSLNRHHNMLYACMEEPLYEDGERAGTGDSTAWVRMIKFELDSKNPVYQFAYQIEPVVHSPIPSNAYRVNGVSEILYAGNKRMIVVERSWSAGQKPSNIKVYLTDHSEASDISSFNSLIGEKFSPAKKTLLLDMDSLGMYIDNIEGITFGPLLSNGNLSLLFISDNNFNQEQVTQILLFELKNFIF